jgi:hypothetical protein
MGDEPSRTSIKTGGLGIVSLNVASELAQLKIEKDKVANRYLLLTVYAELDRVFRSYDHAGKDLPLSALEEVIAAHETRARKEANTIHIQSEQGFSARESEHLAVDLELLGDIRRAVQKVYTQFATRDRGSPDRGSAQTP